MQSIDRLLYSIIIADENEEVEGGGGWGAGLGTGELGEAGRAILMVRQNLVKIDNLMVIYTKLK